MQRHARSLLSLYATAALAMVVSGCNCHPNHNVGDSFAAIEILWTGPDGTQYADRDATFDFGQAFVGDRIAKQMTIRNGGLSTLTLTSLVQASGAPVSIGNNAVENAYFEVKFTPPINLSPSASVKVDMFFTPKAGYKNPVAVLTLNGEGTRPEDSTATITLKGQGNGGLCDLPEVLDFGKVPIGEHFKLGWQFMNPAAIAATAHIGAVNGADAPSFIQDVTGDLSIPGPGSAGVNFTFSPTEKRMYAAQVTMKGPADCPEGNVLLKGEGFDGVLTWTPDSIDYSYVSPGVSAPRNVVFTNLSNVDITISNIQSSYADFAYIYDPATGETPTTYIAKGGGTSNMVVACKPSSLGPRSGTLTFDTGLMNPAHGSISLTCVGGGPQIKVTPRPDLNFGKVAFFPNNSTYNVSRKITVQNVGTKPLNMDPYANLFLGQNDPMLGPGQAPMVSMTVGPNTDLTEFDVGPSAAYNSTTGLEATVGKNTMDLLVTLTPKSIGMKQLTLIINSNDPVEPHITINVTADVEELPPCNLSVAPTMLNFGLVTPPDHKDLGVIVTNLGHNSTDICYLSGIDMALGTDPAFSVMGGALDMKELQPGEVFTIVVRVWPMGAVPTVTQTLTGALHFNVASPTSPQVTVPVQASVGPVCLTVVPDSYDFGNVKKGCDTAPQQFTAYNTCGGDVYINSITMASAAGQPAGGPDCTGGSPCPEFFLTSTPSIPSGGLKVSAGGVIQFSAKYHPIDYGADSGAIAISAIQSGQNVTYLVSLAGTGDMSGQVVDTFVQDQTPKADVLVVVDDSCSMADKQMALGTNFTAFLQYAVSTGTDWQLGVTTTDAAPPICQPVIGCVGGAVMGKLCGGANCSPPSAANPAILTPSMPNVSALFAQKVNVGTNGGTETGLEGAVDALTPPLITGANAGFLRYDANLAVVVVSDAGDQGGKPYSYYLNRLRNVKGYQRANMFTFSDIGPYLPSPPSGCAYDDYTDSATYAQMVADTNGVKAEICTSNWAANLQNLGKTAFGYRTTFFLSSEPDLTGGKTIDVKLDGQPAPATNWTYNATTLSVDFDPMHTPGPGQTLTVTYFRICH